MADSCKKIELYLVNFFHNNFRILTLSVSDNAGVSREGIKNWRENYIFNQTRTFHWNKGSVLIVVIVHWYVIWSDFVRCQRTAYLAGPSQIYTSSINTRYQGKMASQSRPAIYIMNFIYLHLFNVVCTCRHLFILVRHGQLGRLLIIVVTLCAHKILSFQ